MKTFIITLFLFPIFCLAQGPYTEKDISKKTLEIVKKIDGYDTYTGSQSGFSGGPSPQYLEYLKLTETASAKELQLLTDHNNPVVRCYAFDALCEKEQSSLVLEIAKQHSNDHAIMKTMSGCIGLNVLVGDVMLSAATYEDEYVKRPLSQAQIAELDKFIIDSESRLIYKDEAIERLPATEANYETVRRLALTGKSNGAIIKLSEYKKERDIPIFIDFFNSIEENEKDYLAYHAFNRAALNFNHEAFFPLLHAQLVEIVNLDYINHGWQVLYNAIAAYGNGKAAAALTIPFENTGKRQVERMHLEFVHNAIREYPSESFESLQWELWEHENLIDSDACAALFISDTKRAFAISAKILGVPATMKSSEKPNLPNPEDFLYPEEFMLRAIVMNAANPKEIIIAALQDRPYIEIYLNYIKENPDAAYIEPLFKRLASKPQSSMSTLIAETLLVYEDKEITKRLLQVRNENPYLLKNKYFTTVLRDNKVIE